MYNTTMSFHSNIILLALAIAIAITLIDCKKPTSADDDDEFKQWKTTHKKTYKDKTHEADRWNKFRKTADNVAEHNAKFKAGTVTYEQGLNHLSDMTLEEVMAQNGASEDDTPKKPANQSSEGVSKRSVNYNGMEIDTSNFLWYYGPLIRQQGSCGCCTNFASTTALQGRLAYKYSWAWNMKIEFSPKYTCECVNGGCAEYLGANYHDVMSFFGKQGPNGGVPQWSWYPYSTSFNTCPSNMWYTSYVKTGSDGLYYSRVDGEPAIYQALASGGPVGIQIRVGTGFKSYKSGIFTQDDCWSYSNNGHALPIVGYGVDRSSYPPIPYWVIKNSWDTTWGEAGLAKIMAGVQVCGLNQAWYPNIKDGLTGPY